MTIKVKFGLTIQAIMAIATAVQKLKQKSQSNISEISFGARSIILSRTPILLINSMTKAVAKANNIICTNIILVLQVQTQFSILRKGT